jgi:hypothetical protein
MTVASASAVSQVVDMGVSEAPVRRMRKRTVLIVAGAVFALVLADWARVRITPEALRARIARELPRGSPSDKVLSFLDSLGAEHSTLLVNPSPVVTEVGLDVPAGTPFIMGALHGFRKGNLLDDGIFMAFVFDDENRLVAFRARYGFTGP